MQISKQRKIELFIIAFLSIIAVAIFLNYKNLHVKFYNKTGEDLDSLVVGEIFIGKIKNGTSTKYIDYKNFNFDDSLPYEQISGIINSKKLNQLNWSWCGTGRNRQSKGSYVFDLKKGIDEKGNSCLYLTHHNKKIFWE